MSLSFNDVLSKNLTDTGPYIKLLADLHGDKLREPTVIVITGPYCSGKSFLIDLMEAFLSEDGYCLVLPDSKLNKLYDTREMIESHEEIIAKSKLLIVRELTYGREKNPNDIVWQSLVCLSRKKPIVIGLQASEIDMIPINERQNCIIIECSHKLEKSERHNDLRDKANLQHMVTSIRSYLDL
jgi:hypothetical protein